MNFASLSIETSSSPPVPVVLMQHYTFVLKTQKVLPCMFTLVGRSLKLLVLDQILSFAEAPAVIPMGVRFMMDQWSRTTEYAARKYLEDERMDRDIVHLFANPRYAGGWCEDSGRSAQISDSVAIGNPQRLQSLARHDPPSPAELAFMATIPAIRLILKTQLLNTQRAQLRWRCAIHGGTMRGATEKCGREKLMWDSVRSIIGRQVRKIARILGSCALGSLARFHCKNSPAPQPGKSTASIETRKTKLPARDPSIPRTSGAQLACLR